MGKHMDAVEKALPLDCEQSQARFKAVKANAENIRSLKERYPDKEERREALRAIQLQLPGAPDHDRTSSPDDTD